MCAQINYPYATNQLMAAAADACHTNGMKFKIYNTMRELSNRCREIWCESRVHICRPFRSMPLPDPLSVSCLSTT